jgi:hypothetical protein
MLLLSVLGALLLHLLLLLLLLLAWEARLGKAKYDRSELIHSYVAMLRIRGISVRIRIRIRTSG